MAKSSLIVTTEDHTTGNTQQKTITDINPQANDAHLKAWSQMVAGLSKDSYVKSDRVDKRNLDTDSKPDYNVTLQTYKVDQNGVNNFGVIAADVTSIQLSTNSFTTGGNLLTRLRGLTPYTAPYYSQITVNSAEGSVVNRQIVYCTDDYITMNMRNAWLIDLTLEGTFVAGDSFTVTFNVLGDDTHNPYERTITFTFVEWTSPEEGGEG